MKRLWFVVATAAGALMLVAATAAAHPTPRLDLHASPAVVQQGAALTLSGTLATEGVGVAKAGITLRAYDGAGRLVPIGQLTTDAAGQYSWTHAVQLDAGVYSFNAVMTASPKIKSGNVTVRVTPAPVVVPTTAVAPNIFLCYSAWQVNPGVWPESTALHLVTTAGYWQPFGVKGNVPGGTNVGGYHLVCNLPTGQSVPAKHGYVGDGGTLVGLDLHDALAATLGWYPIAP